MKPSTNKVRIDPLENWYIKDGQKRNRRAKILSFILLAIFGFALIPTFAEILHYAIWPLLSIVTIGCIIVLLRFLFSFQKNTVFARVKILLLTSSVWAFFSIVVTTHVGIMFSFSKWGRIGLAFGFFLLTWLFFTPKVLFTSAILIIGLIKSLALPEPTTGTLIFYAIIIIWATYLLLWAINFISLLFSTRRRILEHLFILMSDDTKSFSDEISKLIKTLDYKDADALTKKQMIAHIQQEYANRMAGAAFTYARMDGIRIGYIDNDVLLKFSYSFNSEYSAGHVYLLMVYSYTKMRCRKSTCRNLDKLQDMTFSKCIRDVQA